MKLLYPEGEPYRHFLPEVTTAVGTSLAQEKPMAHPESHQPTLAFIIIL